MTVDLRRAGFWLESKCELGERFPAARLRFRISKMQAYPPPYGGRLSRTPDFSGRFTK